MSEEVEVADEIDPAVATLAYYDSREVPDSQIRRIFSCMQSNLDEVRLTEPYLNELAVLVEKQVAQSADIDDSWDALEQASLGGLMESMDSISDDRMLLGIAVQANKAGRRRGGNSAQHKGTNEIPVQAAAGVTKVVRLRASFLERLRSEDGSNQMLERQATIEATVQGDLDEVIDPRTMKKLLKDELGVDTEAMHVRNHQGPDANPGPYIDFDKL